MYDTFSDSTWHMLQPEIIVSHIIYHQDDQDHEEKLYFSDCQGDGSLDSVY